MAIALSPQGPPLALVLAPPETTLSVVLVPDLVSRPPLLPPESSCSAGAGVPPDSAASDRTAA